MKKQMSEEGQKAEDRRQETDSKGRRLLSSVIRSLFYVLWIFAACAASASVFLAVSAMTDVLSMKLSAAALICHFISAGCIFCLPYPVRFRLAEDQAENLRHKHLSEDALAVLLNFKQAYENESEFQKLLHKSDRIIKKLRNYEEELTTIKDKKFKKYKDFFQNMAERSESVSRIIPSEDPESPLFRRISAFSDAFLQSVAAYENKIGLRFRAIEKKKKKYEDIRYHAEIIYPSAERNDKQSIYFCSHLFGWMTLVLPGIGIIGASLSYLFIRKILTKKGLFEKYQETTRYSTDDLEESDEHIRLEDEIGIEPATDILKGDDENLKRGVVSFLGRLGTPEAIGILRKCLTDESTEVRFQAHSAIIKADNDFTKRIQSIRSKLAPDENQVNLLKDLAKTYRQYAYSGLLEEHNVTHYLNLCESVLLKALDHAENDTEILLMLGNLNISEKKYGQAEKYCKDALVFSENPAEPLLGLCEIYYDTRNLKALRDVAKQMKNIDKTDTGDIDKNILFKFWAQEPDSDDYRTA